MILPETSIVIGVLFESVAHVRIVKVDFSQLFERAVSSLNFIVLQFLWLFIKLRWKLNVRNKLKICNNSGNLIISVEMNN